ncbi:MAG: SAM-dependent methyltransferase [Mediterranea sp.]|jgi:hypothetical protein|nr:SAM-dependent methyltransferase [Mediterranea sp.]
MTLPDPVTLRFAIAHRHDDPRLLALQAARYPDVDMPAALAQIAGRQAARTKLPSWAELDDIVYPPRLPLEQCSSEATARYKAGLTEGDTLADLTGGFGVDCAFMARRFRQATYVERQAGLCRLAERNFAALGLANIDVLNRDGVEYLERIRPVDTIYLDPARRDGHGGKVVAMADCEPDVARLEPLLLRKGGRTLVKLSPMLDLALATRTLGHVAGAHVVSVAGECKELLLLLTPGADIPPDDLPIHCAIINTKGTQTFSFNRRQEREARRAYTDTIGRYLYEPDASLLKAGAFHTLADTYGLAKLHPNSHLYTADSLSDRFPGRSFRVLDTCAPGKREVKAALGDLRQANLTIRNFPATVVELRHRLKLADGGNTYLFATTTSDGRRIFIHCERSSSQ